VGETAAQSLRMWVIYERPSDFPNSCVARGHTVTASGSIPDAGLPRVIGPTVERVRELLPPGLVQIQRRGDDPDPCIAEVWM